MEDQRQERTPEEQAEMLAARKKAEAEAELADERVKMAVYGGGAVGAAGVIIMVFAALWQENVPMVVTGATIALVSFGVVTAAQAGVLFGRGS